MNDFVQLLLTVLFTSQYRLIDIYKFELSYIISQQGIHNYLGPCYLPSPTQEIGILTPPAVLLPHMSQLAFPDCYQT